MNIYRTALLLVAAILLVFTFYDRPQSLREHPRRRQIRQAFCFNPAELVPEFSRNPGIVGRLGLQSMQMGAADTLQRLRG
jgi:hypothetical protein